MNILEHYIEKVISKTPVEQAYIDEDGNEKTFTGLKVKMKINCYGCKETVERLYCCEQELTKDLARGYYWG